MSKEKITFGSIGKEEGVKPRGLISAHKEQVVRKPAGRKPKPATEEKPNKGFSIYFTQTQMDILDRKADGRSRSKFTRDFLVKNGFFTE